MSDEHTSGHVSGDVEFHLDGTVDFEGQPLPVVGIRPADPADRARTEQTSNACEMDACPNPDPAHTHEDHLMLSSRRLAATAEAWIKIPGTDEMAIGYREMAVDMALVLGAMVCPLCMKAYAMHQITVDEGVLGVKEPRPTGWSCPPMTPMEPAEELKMINVWLRAARELHDEIEERLTILGGQIRAEES